MTWVAILVIGVALGWAAELLLDFWYWGRRNRRLQDQLGDCQSKSMAFQLQLKEAQTVVAHYQEKEAAFEKCQVDLADLAGRHKEMAAQAEQMSHNMHAFQDRIGELDQAAELLKAENQNLYDTLEDVDHWVESSMRRNIWDTTSLKSHMLQTKARSKAYAYKMISKTKAHIGQRVETMNGSMAAARVDMGRKISHTAPVRWLRQFYCRAWAVYGSVFKKGTMPAACTFNDN